MPTGMKLLFFRIGAVGVFGLVMVLGIAAFRGHGTARYAAAQKRATDACRAFRDQPQHVDSGVCRYDEFGPLTFKEFHVEEERIEQARAAFARQDLVTGGRALAAASRWAHEQDRTGKSTTYAPMIVRKVVELLDLYGAGLDERTRREVLGNARLEAAVRPFERERLTRLWVLASYEKQRLPDAPPFDPSSLADEMEIDEPAYVEMGEASLLGDVPRCESATHRLGPLSGGSAVARDCSRMADAVRLGARVAAM